MTKDITITDGRGNRLILCSCSVPQDGLVQLQTGPSVGAMALDARTARELVGWLAEALQLAPELDELEEAAPANHLRIMVPGVSGTTREVTWSGDGEPPAWLAQLAHVAVTGAPRPGQAAQDVTRSLAPAEDGAEKRLRHILRAILANAGVPEHVGIVAGVRALAERPDPEWVATLRRILLALGLEYGQRDQAVGRINSLRDQVDTIARGLSGVTGMPATVPLMSQLSTVQAKLGALRKTEELLEVAVKQREGLQLGLADLRRVHATTRKERDHFEEQARQERQAGADSELRLGYARDGLQAALEALEGLSAQTDTRDAQALGAARERLRHGLQQSEPDQERFSPTAELREALRRAETAEQLAQQAADAYHAEVERVAEHKRALGVAREVLQGMRAELSDEHGAPIQGDGGDVQIPNLAVAVWHHRIVAALEGRDPNQS